MIIEEIKGLSRTNEGIWSSEVTEPISYTKDGHNLMAASETESFWHQHRLNVITSIIDLIKIEELLDVGGGNGQVTKYLQDMGLDVALLEPGTSGTLNAQKAGVQKIIRGSFSELDLPPNLTQSIGLFDVLEHIEEDLEFLKKAFETMKPDGYLILTVPALQWLYSAFDKEVGHYRRYSLKQLESKFKEAGFKSVYKTYLFLPLPFLIFPLRTIYRFIGKAQNRRSFGHVNKRSWIGRWINRYLRWELKRIKKQKSLPIGSTCLILAQKQHHEEI